MTYEQLQLSVLDESWETFDAPKIALLVTWSVEQEIVISRSFFKVRPRSTRAA